MRLAPMPDSNAEDAGASARHSWSRASPCVGRRPPPFLQGLELTDAGKAIEGLLAEPERVLQIRVANFFECKRKIHLQLWDWNLDHGRNSLAAMRFPKDNPIAVLSPAMMSDPPLRIDNWSLSYFDDAITSGKTLCLASLNQI